MTKVTEVRAIFTKNIALRTASNIVVKYAVLHKWPPDSHVFLS